MTFLEQVANYYTSDSARLRALADYTFVLPNRRSLMHFSQLLKSQMKGTVFLPNLTTITKFIQNFSDLTLASNNELLFILYNCYIKILKERGREDQITDFDAFAFWGNVLLEDFDDVDSSMVDAEQLFCNVKAHNEISTDYLTPQQKNVASMLGNLRPFYGEADRFWSHIPKKNTEITDNFLNLWEILGDLYKSFKAELQKKGLAYSGMQSRLVSQVVKELEPEYFGHKKFAFVGFYVLSESRRRIFKYLKDKKVAEFFWDTSSPMLYLPGSKIGHLILPLAKNFKPPFELEKIEKMPPVTIYSVPSSEGQTKVASYVLDNWAKEDKKQPKTRPNPLPPTAVILPDERLLTSMLYSLSDEYPDVNVTMQLSMGSTPFASLINTVMLMQENARLIRGSVHYFYKHILELASNPYLSLLDAKGAVDIKAYITTNHIFNVEAEALMKQAPNLAFIFQTVKNPADIESVKEYLLNLIAGFSTLKDEKVLVEKYAQLIDEIFTLAQEYGIKMNQHTYFTLVKKMIGMSAVKINSSPLKGLQIMNMLDARVLDFEDLCILSLNEKVLPKSSSKPSFVPPSMRRGYGMPTPDDNEINSSYLFFRLISRAKRLVLAFDSRSSDFGKGEMSRYVRQLMLAKKDDVDVVFQKVKMEMETSEKQEIVINKNEKVMAEINKLRYGQGSLNLSASALRSYIKCPLLFYLREVKKMNVDDFTPEFIDATSYGQIVHYVAEVLYHSIQRNANVNGGLINKTILEGLLKTTGLEKKIEKFALKQIDRKYYKNMHKGNLKAVPGEGRVQAKVIAKYMMLMLEQECKQMTNGDGSFKFLYGEHREIRKKGERSYPWEIAKDTIVNFTMSIDRVDEMAKDGKLRFIDYKTGSDETKFTSVEDLFGKHKFGGIFQLLLYAIAYDDIAGNDKPIQPIIYLFKDFANGIAPITIGQQVLSSHKQQVGDHQLDEVFRARLVEMITEIFDPEVPITQTSDQENCKYCTFASMCGRFVGEK